MFLLFPALDMSKIWTNESSLQISSTFALVCVRVCVYNVDEVFRSPVKTQNVLSRLSGIDGKLYLLTIQRLKEETWPNNLFAKVSTGMCLQGLAPSWNIQKKNQLPGFWFSP